MDGMQMTEIRHVSDYIRMIEQACEGYAPTHRLLFRGESNTEYVLLPSLFRRKRVGDSDIPVYLAKNSERSILQDFRARAAGYVNNLSLQERFSWIEYAQHFGVPTRLMDWTGNPLVALYFSLTNLDADGRVYLLHETFYRQITQQVNREVFDGRSLKTIAEEMIWEGKKGFLHPVVYQPYYLDHRMQAQSSFFMIWGDDPRPLSEMVEELEREKMGEALYSRRDANGVLVRSLHRDTALTRLIIPKEHKRKLLWELNRMNINHAALFPGLDGIGRTIERSGNIGNMEDTDWF